jgi:phosphate transport system permease protein
MATEEGADTFAPSAAVVRRKGWDSAFTWFGLIATLIGLFVLGALVSRLLGDGLSRIEPEFFLSFPSRNPANAGILSAWVGSLLVMLTTAIVALPLGLMAGLYLEEYAPKNFMTDVIEITVNNLAGVPSIIYGLLALGLFVYAFGFGQSILTAGMTLALLILPIIIVATREAIRAVPNAIREGALALGATKWQTTAHHVLPYSMPGIITGAIIGLSRAIGETAPLITIGALTFIAFLPVKTPGEPVLVEVTQVERGETTPLRVPAGGTLYPPIGEPVTIEPGETIQAPGGSTIETETTLLDAAASWMPWRWLGEDFTVLPIQMFNWTSRPNPAFITNAAAAGLVLLFITLVMNGAAIYLRYRLRRRIRW